MAQRLLLRVEVVTAAGRIYSSEATEVVAPGSEGVLGILPRHAALLTTLKIGALRVKHGGTEDVLFVSGGFMEVYDNKVTVLADEAEHAADVDEARAEEARRRAQALLEQHIGTEEEAALRGEIERAIGRLHVAEFHKQRVARRTPTPRGDGMP